MFFRAMGNIHIWINPIQKKLFLIKNHRSMTLIQSLQEWEEWLIAGVHLIDSLSRLIIKPRKWPIMREVEVGAEIMIDWPHLKLQLLWNHRWWQTVIRVGVLKMKIMIKSKVIWIVSKKKKEITSSPRRILIKILIKIQAQRSRRDYRLWKIWSGRQLRQPVSNNDIQYSYAFYNQIERTDLSSLDMLNAWSFECFSWSFICSVFWNFLTQTGHM